MEDYEIMKQETDQGSALAPSASTFASVFTTVDVNDRQGKNAVLRALNGAESLAASVPAGVVLEVTDFVITPGVRRSRNAGVSDTECLNIYIIVKDGRAFMTQSDGIARSVQQILAMYPNPGDLQDNANGFTAFKVVERTLNNGNTIKSLVPVD